jgi:uncharacterized protein YbjT (DUF2867 family)
VSEKKVVAIIGATGAQGGGLARAILADTRSPFRVRAVTRNPSSDASRALREAGAEVVQADTDDAPSLERAFSGAYGAYCVTNFWEHFSVEREVAQAGNMAAAAESAGVQHLIWSTLEDTRKWVPLGDERMPTLMEHYKVPHYDSKGSADRLFEERGVPTTYLLTSFYWDNFIHFGMGPKPGEDGVLAITLPMGDKKLPGIAAEDIGGCAYGVLQKPDFIGKTVGVAGGHLTGAQMAAAFTRALGREVRYNAVPPEVYRGFGFPGAEDLGNMFQFKHDFEDYYCGARDLAFSRSLNPSLQGFDGWLAANSDRIPTE